MRTVDLPALNDFGAQSDTAWAREKLYELVNYRVHSGAPQPAHGGHIQRDRARGRAVPQPHRQRLKTAVHVHIAAPDARWKIARRACL